MTQRGLSRGVTVALVTPLDDVGEVAREDVQRLITSLRPHVDALLPTLSTGEGRWLTPQQWRDMVSATVEYAGGLPVLAGVQRSTTSEVVTLARVAESLGADGIVATTPYGTTVGQSEMYRHYEELGAATRLPVIVYNESAISGNTLELDTLLRICALPHVVGVKDSSGESRFTRELIVASPGVPVYQGFEHLLLESGHVDGYVISLANVEPALCAALFADPSAELAGKLKDACDQYKLERDDWYQSIKSELHRRGVLTTDKLVERGSA